MSTRFALALLALVAAAAPARALDCPTCTPELAAMLADPGLPDGARLPVLFRMAEQPDLDALVGERDTKAAILPVLVPALEKAAHDSQSRCLGAGCCARPSLMAELDAAGAANVRSYWLPNAVRAELPKAAVAACARRADVSLVHYDGARDAAVPRAENAVPFDSLTAIDLAPAHARGTGAGTVIGIVGTGVDASHPALAAGALRFADGRYVWKDAVAGAPVPYDDVGEGTHLAGVTMAVAPDARWMACKAIERSAVHVSTLKSRLYDCLEWMLHPDPAVPVDPAQVPDVVLTAVFFDDPGACDPYLLDVVRVLRAAHVVPVFPSGHDTIAGLPAAAESLPWPASYPEALSVGASSDVEPARLLATSYRGTAGCRKPGDAVPPNLADRSGPQVFAPGVGVVSAWPGGEYRILAGDPEAVAAAHVAGAAALLVGIAPTLAPDQVRDVLQRTAAGYPPGPPEAAPTRAPGLVDVGRAATLDEAVVVAETPPPAGSVTDESVAVSVSVRNTGVTTWVPGVHQLGAVVSDWSPLRVGPWVAPADPSSGGPAPVPPGKTATFRWNALVPHVPGVHPFQWRLLRGDTLLDWPSDAVSVPVAGTDLAIYLGHGPLPSEPGQSGVADVWFRNAGTNTWNVDGLYQLLEADATNWAGTSVPLSYLVEPTVPPGATGTFRVHLSTPGAAGVYDFQWQLAKNHAPLGIYTPNDRIQIAGRDGARLVGFVPPPDEMRVGSAAWTSITLGNTGSSVWGPGYCLKGAEAWFWSTPDVCLGASEFVAPGQSRIFPLVPIAPDAPQRQSLTYRLHDAAGVPFGDVAYATVGIPWDFDARRDFTAAPGIWGYRYWHFRYQSLIGAVWFKMSWAGDGWATGDAAVWAGAMHPGRGFIAGRFWKSPVNGTVRVSGQVSRRSPTGCGDGVGFTLSQNDRMPLYFARIRSDDWSAKTFSLGFDVAVNDTIRALVSPWNDDACDATNLDLLVQVLPPPWVGPMPVVHPVDDLMWEP
jgi:hypothetical protein